MRMQDKLAIAEQDFPAAAAPAERLRYLVNYAVLAPSGHNTQPWLFRITGQNLSLIADRTRALPVVDPDDRALVISCGAALEHLLIAGRHFGQALEVEELPGEDADHLASVRLVGAAAPTALDSELFGAMAQRRTTRVKYEDRPIPDELLGACRDLAGAVGTELCLVADPLKREQIADLVAEGDRIQFADPRFRRELAAWVHSRRSASRDGMSGQNFGMPDVLSSVGALVIRTFDMGQGVGAGDREKILHGSPSLAVFATPGDGPADWLAAGRALARVFLKLTAAGATAAFLNQPVEVETLRPRLRQAIGTNAMPQLLMRFGYGPKIDASVRRPIDEVLVQ
jgi:hypothetical protein